MSVKQVIIIRRDLQMRRGKEIAQSCHASMAVLLNEMTQNYASKTLLLDAELTEWLNGSFTKICLVVNSEEELLSLYNQAKSVNLRAALIQDSGKTEFHGVPTYTAVAIGPNYSEEIDKITGHLKLY